MELLNKLREEVTTPEVGNYTKSMYLYWYESMLLMRRELGSFHNLSNSPYFKYRMILPYNIVKFVLYQNEEILENIFPSLSLAEVLED